MRLAYAMLWWLLGPWVAALSWLHPRTRVRWAERWSLSLPAVEPGAVIVHAASVGEGSAAASLLEGLRGRGRVLLRTATSDTAFPAARGHHALAAWPLDHPWVVRRWLDSLRPAAIVLIEAELWPEMILAARDRGIPVLRVSPREAPPSARLRRLWPGVFAAVRDLQATALKGEVTEIVQDLPVFPRPCLVAGSTRSGDEARLLEALAELDEPPFLVLAPRHPERFEEVRALVPEAPRRSLRQVPAGGVYLLDTVGELSACYAQADAAFVGGTFDPALGGHSPEEALVAGVPVVHGPAHSWPAPQPGFLAQPLSLAIQRALSHGRFAPAPRGEGRRVAGLVMDSLGPVPVERALRPALAPLAWVYGSLARPRRSGGGFPVPVISVGNLASGGTGKTQVVAELERRLRGRGLRTAVVSRGHGRTSRGLVDQGGAAALGDELAMLGPGLRIACADRAAGIARAVERGAQVVLLDDAYQNAVHRDLDILCWDGVWPSAQGVIPVGSAREPLAAASRADLVWTTRGEGPRGVRSRSVPTEVPAGPVFAFAGLARAGRFLETLVQAGVDVRGWRAFPDHHRYAEAEVEQLRAQGLPLLTTAKDAVRFPGEVGVLELRLELLQGEALLESRLDEVLA